MSDFDEGNAAAKKKMVGRLKKTHPAWKASVKSLAGLYEHIKNDDIWLALFRSNGNTTQAHAAIRELSEKRSMTPEEYAIKKKLEAKRIQLEGAQRDLDRALQRGHHVKAERLEDIVFKLETTVWRLEGPRKVHILLIDDNESRRNEVKDTLEWLAYRVSA